MAILQSIGLPRLLTLPADEVQRTVTILVTDWQQDAASTFDFIAALLPLAAFGPANEASSFLPARE